MTLRYITKNNQTMAVLSVEALVLKHRQKRLIEVALEIMETSGCDSVAVISRG
jgi:hypothetical protein